MNLHDNPADLHAVAPRELYGAKELSRLVRPRSIAVIGASATPGSFGYRTLQNTAFGYTGNVYPINPKHGEILGRACYPTIESLPEVPDCVVLSVAAAQALPIVEQCAALGVGGAVAFAVARVPAHRRRTAGAVVLVLAVAALALSWARFTGAADDELVLQRADAATIASLLDHRGPLYAIGDPAPLVLTGRRNPSRYIYLGSGVDTWKTDHTPGGFAGWTRQIQAVDPAVVVMRTWHGSESDDMKRWLERSYRTFFLDKWQVFVRD
jgi:predicted CoA-binding protein